MKIPATFLLSALLCTAWSCKPQDKTPTPPEDSTPATPAVAEPAPTPEPKPAPTPEPAPAPATPGKLEVGSKVTLDAVKAATWLQGEAPQSFEPGLVYIFEAWATWCGPCVKVIPHMNELHKKYHDKGLRVYGMNVFEDGQEKVTAFIKKMDDKMTYPVAYTGKGSPFEIQWMKAAGARGIPHSFVVIDGVIRMQTHPSTLQDDFIEKLLKGGEEAAKAINQVTQAAKAQDGMRTNITKFREAMKNGDVATMESAITELEKNDPKNMFLGQMKIDIMLTKKEWEKINASVVESPSTPDEVATANMIGTRIALSDIDTSAAPPELLTKLAKIFATKLAQNPQSNPMEWVALSSLQFKTGETDTAKKSARSAIDAAAKLPTGQGMPPIIFTKFSEEVDAGRLPTMKDFSKWLQESAQQRRVKPTPPPAN